MSEHGSGQANLRGKPYRHFDTAGVVTTDRYDFKGNLLRSERQFARDTAACPTGRAIPRSRPSGSPASTTYDALNRPVTVTSPDGSIYYAGYNETGLLAEDRRCIAAEQSATATSG